jgi:hypothetical protein
MNYVNVPATIGCVVSSKMATLAELGSVYGVKDLYDLLEVVMVDAFNNKQLSKARD